MLTRAIILATLILATPAAASEWGRPSDPGGLVAAYLTRNALAGGARDEIHGDCVSACVLRLGNSGACVYESTTLWFHRPRGYGGDTAPAFLAVLPPRVSRFVAANGYLDSNELRPLYGWQLIRMGVRDCRR